MAMNTSIFTADRYTHIKIVVMALIGAVAVSLLSIQAYKANTDFVFLDSTINSVAASVAPAMAAIEPTARSRS
jgi:hypothetical protein